MVIQYACVMQEWTGAAQRWDGGRVKERRGEAWTRKPKKIHQLIAS